MVPAVAITAARHTKTNPRTHFFPIASGSFLKLLGAELRVVDYAGDARLTRRDYRKSQTNSRGDASTDSMVRKQAGNHAIVIASIVSRVHARAISITSFDCAITKLIDADAIARSERGFASTKVTLL